MIPVAAWFERAFNFDFPISLYPNMVERLRGTPARLEDRLESLPTEVLTRRDGPDWSIQEHAGHLWDLEALTMGRLDDFEAGLDTLRAADLGNRKTHEAGHNADTLAHILIEFRQERAVLVSRFESYDEAFVAKSAWHSRLDKPMRVIDLAYFHAEHDDHHIAQIAELIRKFS